MDVKTERGSRFMKPDGVDGEVKLAPPGAGLPRSELFVARIGFGILRAVMGRDRIEAWLRAETGRVLAIARGLTPAQLKRQVLIPKPAGLEDSSRNWSAAMVLQHLVIVDTGIGQLVAALGDGRSFDREVRIADVKPSPEAGEEQPAALEEAMAGCLAKVAAVVNLRTARWHAHPWFGPLDAHGWFALSALHTMIHRRQLEAITQALKK